MSTEIEIKLIIKHPTPESAIDKLVALEHLGKFPLLKDTDQNISDLYFDTPTALLRNKKWAFRLRVSNDKPLITLKGNTRVTAGGTIKRMEIEKKWSREALVEILDIFQKEGLDIPLIPGKFYQNKVIPTLANHNLHPFHQRKTLRKIRRILDPESNREQAELAIDTAIYQIKEYRVIHYELEIEQKSEAVDDDLQEYIDLLYQLFPDQLEIWTMNKLELGIRLEELIDKPDFRKLIDTKKQISPAGYELILGKQ